LQHFSLRSLTMVFLALFLLATILTGIATYSASLDTIREIVDQRVTRISLALAPAEREFERSPLIERVETLGKQRDTGDIGVVLLDPSGRQVAGNMHIPRLLPPGLSTVDVRDNIKGLTKGRALVRAIPGGFRLIVTAETEPFDNYEHARRRIYIIGFGSIIAVVLGGLLLFSRLISHRITQMRRTVDAIVEGDMNLRIPLTGDGSEFDEQAEAFNHMLDRIQGLMAEIQNVSNDISHELRTPLARLRGKLFRLSSHAESETQRIDLGSALEDADELLAMFTAMLRIAEIESGERRGGFASVALDGLASEMVAMLEPVAADQDRRLLIAACAQATLRGDRQLLMQLLVNLVENAVRHTPAGSTVSVSILEGKDHAEIIVSDDGPGIPAEERAMALRRFGRLKRNAAPGHGLGLPLVDAIARLHGGLMRLEDAAPGLRVRVWLPLL